MYGCVVNKNLLNLLKVINQFILPIKCKMSKLPKIDKQLAYLRKEKQINMALDLESFIF